jgi:hypothetical protein
MEQNNVTEQVEKSNDISRHKNELIQKLRLLEDMFKCFIQQ